MANKTTDTLLVLEDSANIILKYFMFKKILLAFLSSLIILQSNLSLVSAQGPTVASPWYDSSIATWYQKVFNQNISSASDIFGERYTAAQVQWVIYSLIVVPIHIIFDSNFTACIFGQAGNNAVTLSACLGGAAGQWLVDRWQGLLNFLTIASAPAEQKFANANTPQGFLNMVFADRADSGINYFRNTFNRVTLIPEVKAQEGFGYTRLDILRNFWTKSRDISYGLLIFAAILMSFLIMFRAKISPQTVISAQSAIPKLIAAIIFITFSYAIAGFMIDLVYVVIGLIATVFTDNADDLAKAYAFMTAGPGNQGIFGALVAYLGIFPIMFAVSLVGTDANTGFLNAAWGSFGVAVIIIIALLIFLIVVVILIIAWLRTLFMLVKALVYVYLLVVFAPFYIVFGTVTPGFGFGSWLNQLVSHLAVFPAVGLMLMLSMEFMRSGAEAVLGQFPGNVQQLLSDNFEAMGVGGLTALTNNEGWSPPLLAMGSGSAALMLQFVSLSIVLLIPSIAGIIQGFMSGRPFAYESAIGAAAGAGAVGLAIGAGREGISRFGAGLVTERVQGAYASATKALSSRRQRAATTISRSTPAPGVPERPTSSAPRNPKYPGK